MHRMLVLIFEFLLVGMILTTNAQVFVSPQEQKEVLVFGEHKDSFILNAQGLTFLAKNNLVVTDKLDYSIKKFDSSGKKIQQVGKRGTGKGLFREPGPIDAYANLIAVADLASTRIQVFDTQLQHVREFSVPGAIFDLKFDRDGRLWIGALTGSKGNTLLCYTPEGKAIRKIALRNSTGNVFGDVFSLAISSQNEIIVAYVTKNNIEIWDPRGVFKREFYVPGLPSKAKQLVQAPRFGAKATVPEGKISRSLTTDEHGRLYILAADYTPTKYCDVYVLDSSGALLGMLTLPHPSAHIRIGPDGFLYSIDRKRMAIRKYSMPKVFKK